MSSSPTHDLADPRLYINRELSLLEFNRRVLLQALDERPPLLERVRFLSISASNLDEFFEIRTASHQERAALGIDTTGLDGRTSQQTLTEIHRVASGLVEEQYDAFNSVILPALATEGINLVMRAHWTEEQTEWIASYFRNSVLPVLTPVGLDPAHPFPRILNKSLNFAVVLDGEDAFGRDIDLAVVQVPRSLPRLVPLPSDVSQGKHDLVMLSSVIHASIDELFPGVDVVDCHQFRVTRNGDLWVDEEDVDDVLEALQGELPERRYSEAVRLEVTHECPDEVAQFLLAKFGLRVVDLYRVDGPVNLHRLDALHGLVDRPDLKYEPLTPRVPRAVRRGENLFEAIRAGDILLHHPYESFQPVLELLRQASHDPNVLAIKQTLYRTGRSSSVAEALIEAARNGKQVTVVIELRARFDEEPNIDLATRLQEAGANVVYGVAGYKTHSKMLMIVRREGERLRRYLHLGTGNYHPVTARLYTDIGLLTAREDIGRDVDRSFNLLTGVGRAEELEALMQAPFSLHTGLLALIEGETKRAQAGERARILAKMNALTNRSVIQALYRASQAGVEIDLIIRGPCGLRPGIPEISENIRVTAILGRFLEHSRLWYFHSGGKGRLFASSADWMSRNLLRRTELAFPIDDPEIRARLLHDDLEIYLEEGVRAWRLRSTGDYELLGGDGELDAQYKLIEAICSSSELQLESDSDRPGRFVFSGGNDRAASEKARRRKEKKNRKPKKRR